MVLESRGVPTIAVATEDFRHLADQCARDQQIPGARIAVVPHPIGGTALEILDEWAVGVVDEVLRLLGAGSTKGESPN